jgi:uncharacterized membrane protein (UPF0127 family)
MFFSRALMLCMVLLLPSVLLAQSTAQQKLRTSPLIIQTAKGKQYFTVEMALSNKERERGLMFRETLGEDEGMLFFFEHDEQITMWMKNTLVPLDMIFIGADGEVAGVSENAVPKSLRHISSGVPVRAVLEIKAGLARRLQVEAGSVIRNVLFGNLHPGDNNK